MIDAELSILFTTADVAKIAVETKESLRIELRVAIRLWKQSLNKDCYRLGKHIKL